MTDEQRRTLEELERRKAAMEDPCGSCGGDGYYLGMMCSNCLGQGVEITAAERDWLIGCDAGR